jgi:hypothetical protein
MPEFKLCTLFYVKYLDSRGKTSLVHHFNQLLKRVFKKNEHVDLESRLLTKFDCNWTRWRHVVLAALVASKPFWLLDYQSTNKVSDRWARLFASTLRATPAIEENIVLSLILMKTTCLEQSLRLQCPRARFISKDFVNSVIAASAFISLLL